MTTGRDFGHEFTLDLCEAIARTTRDLEAADVGAFSYRGADLTYGVERELYIRLVNHLGARRLYELKRQGDALTPIRVASHVEREVIERLVPGVPGVEVAADRSRAGRLAGAARAFARRLTAGAPKQLAVPSGSMLIVVHHPKFLRFIEPVLAHLDRAEIAVAWTTHDVSPELAKLDVQSIPLAVPRARMRSLFRTFDSIPAFDTFHSLFSTAHPRSVLVIEGNHPWDEVANRAAQQFDVPCFCLQHGWSPIVHNGFRNMSFTEMLVWGNGFAELLRPYNPGLRFASVGDPAFDSIPTAGSTSLERNSLTFFLQAPSQLLGPDDLEELKRLVHDAVARFPGIRALVREHPSWPLGDEERAWLTTERNVSLVPPSAHSLPELLAASVASVSAYSTTILESIAMLVPPVVFNTTSMPRYSPDVEAAGAGREVRTREDALAEIARLLDDPTYRQRYVAGMTSFRRAFFGELDGRAGQRVASKLEQAS